MPQRYTKKSVPTRVQTIYRIVSDELSDGLPITPHSSLLGGATPLNSPPLKGRGRGAGCKVGIFFSNRILQTPPPAPPLLWARSSAAIGEFRGMLRLMSSLWASAPPALVGEGLGAGSVSFLGAEVRVLTPPPTPPLRGVGSIWGSPRL